MIHKELTDTKIVSDQDVWPIIGYPIQDVHDSDLSDEEIESMLVELEVPNDIHFNDEIPDYQGIRDMADDLLGGK
jgi:hypothetical protein